MNTFAKQKSNKENDVNFVYQHNNSTLILLAATKNILDFCFVLKKLAAGQNDILSFWILRYLRDLLDLLQHFYKHQAVIQKYQFTIRQKTISSFEQLRAMSDEELLKYFPNTSAADLQRFRRDDWGTF